MRFLRRDLTGFLAGYRRHHHWRLCLEGLALSLELNLVGAVLSRCRCVSSAAIITIITGPLILGGCWLYELQLLLIQQAGHVPLLLLLHLLLDGQVGAILVVSIQMVLICD